MGVFFYRPLDCIFKNIFMLSRYHVIMISHITCYRVVSNASLCHYIAIIWNTLKMYITFSLCFSVKTRSSIHHCPRDIVCVWCIDGGTTKHTWRVYCGAECWWRGSCPKTAGGRLWSPRGWGQCLATIHSSWHHMWCWCGRDGGVAAAGRLFTECPGSWR